MANKLSVTEIYYIEQNPENLSDIDLAKKLGRNVLSVKKIREKKLAAEAKKAENIVQEQPQPPQVPPPQDLPPPRGIVRKTFGHVRKNGQSRATIMTPAASEIGDEARKHNKVRLTDALKNAIHRPYGDNHGE